MTRRKRVKELFQQALDLPDAERSGFLAVRCGDDAELRAEVEGLLQALADASGFLCEPGTDRLGLGPGTVIDRYRLIDRLGEGGFGVVFRAEQQAPLRREVALKVVKLGMDTRAVIARFEHERQALARMQHPHIATVLDGGSTPAGRPYFVMELVRGLPVTRFCQEHGLGIGERVGLLRQVCLAVQHAHQKGVVHRDLKPGNILVSVAADGTPVPKVIDFGIAKAVDDDGADRSFTATRPGQAIGTLEYMAPEQAAGQLDELDSRADVYSLGVVLYEVLTGRRPFERSDAGSNQTAELLERIREQQPQRPSACVAAGRAPMPLPGADRARWARRLERELDWITGRALAKEPARRYPTASALGDDLGAFLEGLPVQAGPPTRGYWLRRFVARHRLLVGAVLLLLISLAGGVVATALALAEARRSEHALALESTAKDRVNAELRAASARLGRTVEALRGLLLAADPYMRRGAGHTVRELLDDFAGGIDERFGDDPGIGGELHLTVGGSYRNLGELAKGEHHLGRARELLGRATGERGRDYERALVEWSFMQRELGRYDEADAAAVRAWALAEERAAEPSWIARLLLIRSDLHRLRGETDLVEQGAEEGLHLLADLPGSRDVLADRAMALDLLGVVFSTRGDARRSLALHREALELRQQCYADGHVLLATSWLNVAAANLQLGDLDAAGPAAKEALRLHEHGYGSRHPLVAQSLAVLGDVALKRKQLDEAERLYLRAQEIRTATLPPEHDSHASSLSDLGRVALARGDLGLAEQRYRAALAQRERGALHRDQQLAAVLHNLGVVLNETGRPGEAEACYRQALELHRQDGGDANPKATDAMQNIALALHGQGRFREACELHAEVLRLRREHLPEDLERQVQSCVGMARAAEACGDPGAAARAQEARLGLLLRMGGSTDQQLSAVRLLIGRRFVEAGEPVAAQPHLEAAHAFCREHLGGRWPEGDAASLLAACRAACGAWEEAVVLAEQGARLLAQPRAPVRRRHEALERLIVVHEGAAAAAADPAVAARHRAGAAAARRRLAASSQSPAEAR